MPPTADQVEAALNGRFTGTVPLAPGGQGTVFRATRQFGPERQTVDDDVAIKVYSTHVEGERVDREIDLMLGIRHRCLPVLLEHAVVSINGEQHRVVVWEFVDGTPLADRIAVGPLPLREVAVIGRDVASAIAAIWSKRVVHRDVKPANILIRSQPTEAVLVDLGAARHLDASTITQFGFTLGTIGYLSPEQARTEKNLTCKSDIYSLGVVLMECLAGAHPTGRNQVALTNGTLTTATVAPMAPVRLARLLDSMLLPRAAHRPTPEAAAIEFDHLAGML